MGQQFPAVGSNVPLFYDERGYSSWGCLWDDINSFSFYTNKGKRIPR